jgi:hypothetical protein
MARHIDQTMGKLGTSLSWQDFATERRGMPAATHPDIAAPEPNRMRPPLDAVEEDFSEPLPVQRYSDAEPSVRSLVVASVLVVLVVVGL